MHIMTDVLAHACVVLCLSATTHSWSCTAKWSKKKKKEEEAKGCRERQRSVFQQRRF